MYPYTQHLLQLESHTDAEPILLPPSALNIITPLIYHQWEKALILHPDRQFVQYLLSGIEKGFHTGVNRLHTCKRAKGNMHSALVHPTPVEDYLHTELQASRIIGPISDNSLIQISRFGVIPKSGQPRNWHLILDLSSPHGSSVNDAIYTHIHNSRSGCQANLTPWSRHIIGQNRHPTRFSKRPDSPSGQKAPWNVMEWMCVCGHSSPIQLTIIAKIFNAIADALEWILSIEGVTDLLH